MDRLPLITSAFLNVTNACPLSCGYCFVEQHPNYMPLAIARDTVGFLMANAEKAGKTPSITFFGGEPMLCFDSVIKPLIAYINNELKVPFSFSMTTNGVLLTQERIEFLYDNNVSIMLSIDGDKATQDFNRPFHNGNSSFDEIVDKIPLLLKHNPNMTFRSTLIPETSNHIFENIMFAEECGYTNFFLIPNVFQTWSSKNRTVAEHGFQRYIDYFIESCRNGRIPIRCNPLEDGLKHILELNSAIANGQCVSCKTAQNKCGLGVSRFASVDYRGNIYACQEMASCKGESDPFYIGNIYTGVREDQRLRLSNAFSPAALVGEDCSTCKLRRICDGGCVANNYLWSGDINHVSPDYCWWIKLMFDKAVELVSVLGNEKNECFKEYWYSLNNARGCICKN